MTRERAARIITIILDCCKGKEEDYEEHEIIPLEESFKALGMAIEALDQEPIRCRDCKFMRCYEDEGYNYCALENRPNRNWSVDETDFCSWAERMEGEEE